MLEAGSERPAPADVEYNYNILKFVSTLILQLRQYRQENREAFPTPMRCLLLLIHHLSPPDKALRLSYTGDIKTYSSRAQHYRDQKPLSMISCKTIQFACGPPYGTVQKLPSTGNCFIHSPRVETKEATCFLCAG